MDNRRNYWITGIVIVLIIIAGVWIYRANTSSYSSETASTTPDSGITTVLPYGRVTLALGQSGAFPGITIKPVAVLEDSRCAAGVQCIWAGTVRVSVESTLDSGANFTNTIGLGSTTPISSFAVSLVSVDPAPRAGEKIPDQDYRFTFDVHQNGTGDESLEGKG